MNPPTQPNATPLDADVHEATAAARRATDLAAVRQRLDWLFRHAQPSPAMKALRDMVQRYREGDAV